MTYGLDAQPEHIECSICHEPSDPKRPHVLIFIEGGHRVCMLHAACVRRFTRSHGNVLVTLTRSDELHRAAVSMARRQRIPLAGTLPAEEIQ